MKQTKNSQTLGSLILQSFKDESLDGWKDDKEKFKIELLNDIKTFLLGKWEKPWRPGLIFDDNNKVIAGFRNISGRVYKHESNILSLKSNASENPYFITLSKLKSDGGTVTDKSKIVGVLSFIPMFKKGNEPEAGEKKAPDFRLPKMHHVINVDFTNCIKKPTYNRVEFEKLELNEYVENFVQELKKRKRIPKLFYDQSDKAYYAHTHTFSTDKIHLVPINNFKNIEEYYSTLFHEITHSTMNPQRCGRGKFKFENKLDYPNEELVAEMGAMIVASELGLAYNRQNSITYLKGWLSRVKGDKDEALLESYAYACDAAEYLMDDIDFDKLVPKSMGERAKKEQKEKELDAVAHIEPDFVSYKTAYDAHRGTSMTPEKRAKQYQKSFADESNDFADQINAIAQTSEQKEHAKVLFKDYLERRKSKWVAWMNAKSRCLSILVTGASNFPVRRNEKANNTEQKRGEEYFNYIDKAEKRILAEIKNLDKEALAKEKSDENSKKIIADLATILGIVKGELPYTKSLIVNSMMRKLEKMPTEARSFAIQTAKELQEKHKVSLFAKNHRFWKMIDKQDEVKEADVNKGEETIFENDEVKIINSFTDERIRIAHEEKPDKEVIAYLKKHGFKWSHKNKAWQRMNTAFGIKEANIFIDKFYPQSKDNKEVNSKEHTPKQLTLALNGLPLSSKSKKDIKLLIRFYNCIEQERQKRSLQIIQKGMENALKGVDKDVVYYPYMVRAKLMLEEIIQQMNVQQLTHVTLEINKKSYAFFNELSEILSKPEELGKPKATATLNGSGRKSKQNHSNILKVNKAFNDDLDLYIDNKHKGTDFYLGKPGKILQSKGLENLDIILSKSILTKKIKKHGFKAELLKDLPKKLNAPIMLFDSKKEEDKPYKNSKIIVVGGIVKGEGILTVIVTKDKYNKLTINKIDSIGGRNAKQIWFNIEDGNLRHHDKQKILKHLTEASIASDIINAQDFDAKIRDYFGIANKNLSGTDKEPEQVQEPVRPEPQEPVLVSRFTVDIAPEPPASVQGLNGTGDNGEVKSDLFTPITAEIAGNSQNKIELPTDLGKFLGYVERYEYSILLRGEKGAGKSRMTYQMMNTFAKAGFTVGCFSLEIGKQSNIVKDMRDTYISPTIADRVQIADSAPNGLEDIKTAARMFDVVCIDSWGKIPNVKSDDFDKLRKEFPETMFIVIFQSTTNGTARGGSAPEYDAGIVIQVQAGGRAICEKNRYSGEDLMYLVFERRLATPEEMAG